MTTVPTTGLSFDDVVTPFAEAIFIKVTMIRSGRFDKVDIGHLKETIRHDLRKCSDIIIRSIRRPEVSEAAHAKGREMGIADLRDLSWSAQAKLDPGRVTFILEHVIPVRTLQEAALAASSSAEIVEILRGGMRVAWILKTENSELGRLGFTTKRPDPIAAYEAAGIHLLPA